MKNAKEALSKKELTLTQLRYFIAAATHRSMTGAATELYIAQSAVSTAISQLEWLFEVSLFIRQPSKGLALTPSGKQLLRDARSLLAHLDELTENVRAQDQSVKGVLRLACFVTLAPFLLPQLISEIGEHHPELRIEVFEADFSETSKMLLDGTVEGALTYNFGTLPGLSFMPLYTAPPHVILPAEDPLAQHDEIDLVSLQNLNMVLLDIPHSREYFLDMLRTSGVQPNIRHSSRSYETVRSLVAHGHGFSILNNIPKSGVTYDGGRLKALTITNPVPSLSVCFTHPTDIRPSARARTVAATAAKIMQKT